MRHVFLSVLTILLGGVPFAARTASAEQVLIAGVGSVDASGSVLGADGLWHYGGIGYARTLVPGYWVRTNCCWRWVAAYYVYTPVPVKAQTLEDKVLAMAKVVNDTNEAIKARQEEVNRAIQLADKFGLGPFPSYSRNPFPPPAKVSPTPTVFLSSAGVNSTTIYGMTLQQAIEAYLKGDDAILMQALAGSLQQSGNIFGRANEMVSDRVAQGVEGRKLVAETLARSAGGAELLSKLKGVLDGPASVTVRSQHSTFSTAPREDALAVTATALNCVQCHAGPQAAARWDVTQFRLMSPELQQRAIDRMTTADLSKRMPRDSADPKKPGAQATAAQVDVFRANMAKTAAKQ